MISTIVSFPECMLETNYLIMAQQKFAVLDQSCQGVGVLNVLLKQCDCYQ
ncbi:hypothetical protein Syun_012185 [Stephania yunnanensis]|uniref:Uncharacterized protein n=1 Tax=Stephania yunnanensis TaxID=152371 RepID=A0AAP0K190_9MAGN